MTKQFDNTQLAVLHSIRKPCPPPKKVIASDKDKALRRDKKLGRKNWKQHDG